MGLPGFAPFVLLINKQVTHCLIISAFNKLLDNRVFGNKDSSLGSIQDLKYVLANNMLAKTQVEELVAA